MRCLRPFGAVWALVVLLCAQTAYAQDETAPATGTTDLPATENRPEKAPERPTLAVPGEVVVIEDKAPLAPATASARIVGADVIAVTPRRSASDLLTVVPGLHMSQHGAEGKGQQFFLRGFDAVHGADLEALVAGIPINELSNVHGQGYIDLGFVIPEAVLELSAQKGSFSVDQGRFATAGSVAFSLGVPAAARGTRIGYEIGTTNRHRLLAVVAPKNQPEATFVAVEALADAGFGENRDARRLSAIAQYRIPLPFAGDTWVQILGLGYAAGFGEPGVIPLDDYDAGNIGFFDTYSDADGESYRALASVRFHRERGPDRTDAMVYAGWRKLTLSENFTGALLYPEHGDLRRQRHRARRIGVRAHHAHDIGDALTITAGGEALAATFSQSESQLDEQRTPWQRNRDLAGEHVALAAYLGAIVHTERLTIRAGSRIDGLYIHANDAITPMRSGDDFSFAVSPRLSSSLALGQRLSLFAAYGRGVRPPEARAVTAESAPSGSTDPSQDQGKEPRMTVSDAAELGVRYRPAQAVEVGAAAFATWISNELLFDHLSGINIAVGATRRLGGEAFARYVPRPWLTLRADITAVRARFVGSQDPVPNVPTLLAGLEARAALPSGWRGGVRLDYLGPRTLAHNAHGSAHAVVDVIAGYRRGDFRVDLTVENALGSRYHAGEYSYASWFDRTKPRSLLPRIHFAAGAPINARVSITHWF